jgi:hypothetical protein
VLLLILQHSRAGISEEQWWHKMNKKEASRQALISLLQVCMPPIVMSVIAFTSNSGH